MSKWRELIDTFPEFEGLQDKIEKYCEYHEWVEMQKPKPNLEKTIRSSLYVLSKLNKIMPYTSIYPTTGNIPFGPVKSDIQFIFSKKPIESRRYTVQSSVEQLQVLRMYGVDPEVQLEYTILNEIVESIRNLKDELGRPVNKVVFGQVVSDILILEENTESFCQNNIRLVFTSEFRPITRADKLERILRIEPSILDI